MPKTRIDIVERYQVYSYNIPIGVPYKSYEEAKKYVKEELAKHIENAETYGNFNLHPSVNAGPQFLIHQVFTTDSYYIEEQEGDQQ